jgi:nitrite reductase/ring-hydroxylating ferredoxin subunit
MSDLSELQWHRLLGVDDLEDGRVTVVQVGPHSLAVTRVGDQYSALDNHCPHQGGPLGEGSIENGLLRCPWHGYD